MSFIPRRTRKGTVGADGIVLANAACDACTMRSPHLTETQEAGVSQAVERLLVVPEESSRRVFLEQNPQLQLEDMVLYLATQVPKIARDDTNRALQMAGLASWLAEILNDDYCCARSARAMGHVLQLKGKLRESLLEYQKALDLFTKLKLEPEIGITLSGSLQPLILLGDYREAQCREEKARKIFKAQGDELRLARLDSNLGNILHRQDRFEEALVVCRPLSRHNPIPRWPLDGGAQDCLLSPECTIPLCAEGQSRSCGASQVPIASGTW